MAADRSVAFQAERIAVLYRRVVLMVGAQLLGGFLGRTLGAGAQAGESPALGILSLLVLLAAFAAGVANAVFTYQLMGELGASVPWLWAIGIFIPCLSIIVLLVLSSRAQAWCKEHGIKVGLLGPTKESIEQLKRQSSVGRVFD